MKIKSFFKVSVIAVSVAASFSASAGISIIDNEKGTFSIGGDVEFDLTADDYTDLAQDQDNNATAGGRILIDFSGERVLENGNFAAFKVNPLYKQQGGTALDDAWFKFGAKNDWNFTLGHFEAGDLSPAGQDTYVVDNSIYQADTARGRLDGSDITAGQVMFQKTMGAWGFELSSMIGANEGQDMDAIKTTDALIARPIVTWAGDMVSVAVGAEVNLVQDAYVNIDGSNASEWTGYGATTTIKVNDDLSFSLQAAFKDDNDADQLSAGIGAQYQNFFAKYIYGTTDGVTTAEEVTENVAYVSYRIPSILDLDNFDIYLAASYGSTEVNDQTTDETGGRIRFKYFF